MRLTRSYATLVAIVICVAALAVLCWRMLHGVDFTDESFYVAQPYRYALGDRPFIDELSVAQTSGLLLYPFVKAYVMIKGDTTGIFLFTRSLLVVMFGLVGWSAYALARLYVSRAAALLIGTMCMLVLPYGIPGLSYNTLSMGLHAAGLFVVARALIIDPPPRPFWRAPMYWAGFAHGAAVFAYASLLFATAATVTAIFALAPRRRLRTAATYAAGGLTFALLVSPLFIYAGIARLRVALAYSAGAFDAFTLSTVWARVEEFVSLHPELPYAVVAILGAMILARWLPLLVASCVVALPLLACGSRQVGNQASLGFIACFALFGPLLATVLRERRGRRVLVFGVVVPSMVAAAIVCLSSGNRSLAAGVGLYPAAIASAVLLVMFIAQTAEAARWPALHPYLALAPAAAVAALCWCLVLDRAYYRDGPRSAMTERVTSGPFLGMYTTPANAELLDVLTRDIHEYIQGPRALFFYDLPIGYLIAQRRPMVSSTWIFAMWPRHVYDQQLFRKWAKRGELVILDWDHLYPLERIVARKADILAIRPQYTVYRLREDGRTP